jgi:hypothetical protein
MAVYLSHESQRLPGARCGPPYSPTLGYSGEPKTYSRKSIALFLGAAMLLLSLASPARSQEKTNAPETIGGGTVASPAVGPRPSFGIGGSDLVLVKNWRFGTSGTIKNYADMNANFVYHDQFGTIGNGTNYGAGTVAPIDLVFLFDAGWAHTQIGSVNRALPASALTGKFYEWSYSRVYLNRNSTK